MSEVLAPKIRSKRSAAGACLKVRKFPRRESMDTLAKGLRVIKAFSQDRATLRLCDVAKLTAMAPATARRCLMALEDLGYIMRYGSMFSLRPKVLELTAAYLDVMHLDSLTTHLQSLTERTGDSSAVCVLDGVDIVYVAHADLKAQIRIGIHIGSRFPALATSGGRVLLAALDPMERGGSPQIPLGPMSSEEIVPRDELPAVLQKCLRNGYSALANEMNLGVVSVAVPVVDQKGRVIAALCSASQSSKISVTKLVKQRLDLLRTVSRQITADVFSGHAVSSSHRHQLHSA